MFLMYSIQCVTFVLLFDFYTNLKQKKKMQSCNEKSESVIKTWLNLISFDFLCDDESMNMSEALCSSFKLSI